MVKNGRISKLVSPKTSASFRTNLSFSHHCLTLLLRMVSQHCWEHCISVWDTACQPKLWSCSVSPPISAPSYRIHHGGFPPILHPYSRSALMEVTVKVMVVVSVNFATDGLIGCKIFVFEEMTYFRNIEKFQQIGVTQWKGPFTLSIFVSATVSALTTTKTLTQACFSSCAHPEARHSPFT